MPRHSPRFPRAGLLISHTFPSAVMWCSSHCLLLCGLCLFHLQFLSTCLGSRVGFPSQALPLLHTRAWLPITPHPAQPRSPKLPIRLLSSLCTSTGNSEKNTPYLLTLFSLPYQPIVITCRSPWLSPGDSASNT